VIAHQVLQYAPQVRLERPRVGRSQVRQAAQRAQQRQLHEIVRVSGAALRRWDVRVRPASKERQFPPEDLLEIVARGFDP
jgi:hypothetical protein